MSRARVAGWLACGLCWWPWWGAEPASAPLPERLFGPAAGLVASAAWVRFDLFVREGRYEAAYAAAERALDLDPRAPQGWIHLAAHLARFRASPENEPDPARRREWIQAALDLLARGETRCAEPGELAHAAGVILLMVAAFDEPTGLGWPGGADAAQAAAAGAFARARALGVHALDPREIEHENGH